MSTTDSGPRFYPGAYAERFPDKPAYIMAGTGETVTYRELNDRSNQLAQLLYQRGVRPGEAICICMENNATYLIACWAAQRSGLYYTVDSCLLATDETEYSLTHCGARAYTTTR